jgi:hypothetical protein
VLVLQKKRKITDAVSAVCFGITELMGTFISNLSKSLVDGADQHHMPSNTRGSARQGTSNSAADQHQPYHSRRGSNGEGPSNQAAEDDLLDDVDFLGDEEDDTEEEDGDFAQDEDFAEHDDNDGDGAEGDEDEHAVGDQDGDGDAERGRDEDEPPDGNHAVSSPAHHHGEEIDVEPIPVSVVSPNGDELDHLNLATRRRIIHDPQGPQKASQFDVWRQKMAKLRLPEAPATHLQPGYGLPKVPLATSATVAAHADVNATVASSLGVPHLPNITLSAEHTDPDPPTDSVLDSLTNEEWQLIDDATLAHQSKRKGKGPAVAPIFEVGEGSTAAAPVAVGPLSVPSTGTPAFQPAPRRAYRPAAALRSPYINYE